MKKFSFILMMLCLSACVSSEDANQVNVETPLATQPVQVAPVIDKEPMRIIPRVEVKNSKVVVKKDLFILDDASLVCSAIIDKKYEKAESLDMSTLEESEKDRIGLILEKYTKKVPDNFIGVVLKLENVDYDNDGFDDLIVKQGFNFLKTVDGNEEVYDYDFLSLIKRKSVVELIHGEDNPYYYQGHDKTSQDFIKVNDKYYLATFNKNNRITRVDKFITFKHKTTSHLICEFGAQQ